MNGRQFFELLARLPARVWLQAIVGLIGFVVLAALGFALLAGVAAVVVVTILAFKAKAWLRDRFGPRPPPDRDTPRVIDVPYEIVDRRDDEKKGN